MDDKQIQQLAIEIANRTAYHNWEYWLALLGVAVVAAAGSFLGGYFKRRGEQAATDADLKKILAQLELTTRTAETIKSVVSLGEWSERERRTLRRIKLEELIIAAHGTEYWMESEGSRHVFSLEDVYPQAPSPLSMVVTLGKLFFSELRPKIADFELACKTYQLVYREVREELIRAKMKILATPTSDPPGWNAEIRTGHALIEVRLAFTDRLVQAVSAMHQALMDLDEAAAELMKEIIAVSPPYSP